MMKKNFSRLLSLVLVLVMVLGVIPVASAVEPADGNFGAGAVTLSANPTTLEVGGAAVLTAAAPYDSTRYNAPSFEWSATGGTISGSGSTVAFVATDAGTATVSVSVTCTGVDTGNPYTLVKSVDLTVTAAEEEEHTYVAAISPASLSLQAGESAALSASLKDNGTAVAETGYTVEWSIAGDSDIGLINSEVFVASTATVGDKATVTAAISVGGEVVDTENCEVTVVAAPSYTVSLNPASLDVDEGGTEGLPAVSVKDGDGQTVSKNNYEVTWTSADETIAKISYQGTAVSGVAAGTTTITATVKIGEEVVGTADCTVTVGGGAITCSAGTKAASTNGATITLTPRLDGYTSSELDYKYILGTKRGDVTLENEYGSSCVVKGVGVGGAVVKIEAYKDDVLIATGETTASFYQTNNVEVTMESDLTTMTFNNAAHIVEGGSLGSKLLSGYYGTDVYNSSDLIKFSGLLASEGTLDGGNYSASTNSAPVNGLDKVTFTIGSAGVAEFSYQILAGDILLSRGTITIHYDGELGAIEYSCDHDETVTFARTDFAKYWTAAGMKTDLEYVEFTITSTYPAYGTLYTSTTNTGDSYKAQSYHKFYYGTAPSGVYNKSLSSVTYRPLASKTSTYDITIPFVAYGDEYSASNTDDKVNGTVVIHMNPATNAITPRGVYMGTEYDKVNDLTYVDQMKAAYEQKSGRALGQVVFTLPDAEKATLFEKIPTSGKVAQGTQLAKNKTLYVSAPSNTSSAYVLLKNVALVPAAGYSGEITLTFVGKDSAGNNAQTCSITFKVETKTDSDYFTDVTPTSYSWAADSADFLYLEGIAKGSGGTNNKYNPKANITRGDFMLMLYRAFLEERYGDTKVTTNFPDVIKGTDTYSQETYQAVGVAKYLGIAKGTNGYYNPKDNITREEAMVLIYRTMEVMDRDLRYSTTTKASSFSDYSKISTWATDAISDLVAHGVIKGNNNKIDPKSNITRAEMACILHRVITY